jgi:hypothetical protein
MLQQMLPLLQFEEFHWCSLIFIGGFWFKRRVDCLMHRGRFLQRSYQQGRFQKDDVAMEVERELLKGTLE